MNKDQQPQTESSGPQPVRGASGINAECFRGAALGIAVAYIAAGLFGMIFDKEVSATTLALVFAVFGYLIAKKRYDKTHPAVTEDTVEDSPAGSSEPDGE